MALDFAQFQTEMQAVKDSIGNQNYAGARLNLALARITYLSLPEALTSGERGTTFRKTLDELTSVIDQAEAANVSGGGTTMLPVQLGRSR